LTRIVEELKGSLLKFRMMKELSNLLIQLEYLLNNDANKDYGRIL
jgi:hypothetical protein